MAVVIMGNNNLMDQQQGDTPMQGILWFCTACPDINRQIDYRNK